VNKYIRITSSQNNVIKQIKKINSKKVYNEDKQNERLFCIEGIRFVEEAAKDDIELSIIVYCESFIEKALNNKYLSSLQDEFQKRCKGNIYIAPDNLFNQISETQTPQGVLAVASKRFEHVSMIESNCTRIILLEALKDPGNMGTIIRTADAASFSAVVVCGGCVDVFNPKVLRSTMGSIFHVPVFYAEDFSEASRFLRNRDIKIISTHLKAQNMLYDIDLSDNIAIAIGNEANGLSDEAVENSDILVKIPMPGKAESLNASVAASIMMYESVRQNYLKHIK